ncbi:MAG: MmcB family DNA repair protein [Pseudomonadota bacterium]
MADPLPSTGENNGTRASGPGGAAAAALRLCRGVTRMLYEMGQASLPEMTLANGRRADLVALDAKGQVTIVEIKSCINDFRTDAKWPEYEPFCDEFYFAVSNEFPIDVLPAHTGLIIADGFGGAIVRRARLNALPAARRKAVTLRFARLAATRHAAPLLSAMDGGGFVP